jgi:hypothetical protein
MGPDWRQKENAARRWIEDQGFAVHDANIVFRSNCPNIDLIVYGKRGAIYVQTKSSTNPAGRDSVIVDGSPWTDEQLQGSAIYNRHDQHFRAAFIILVDTPKDGSPPRFYVVPPDELERLARTRGLAFAKKLKRDGSPRSVGFRKELPRAELDEWRDAWRLLGEPLGH